MAEDPIISFRAGMCNVDDSSQPYKVKPKAEEGYIYLFKGDDELVHFCWRARNRSHDAAGTLDLTMIPEDGHFVPYKDSRPGAKTNGRIFVLKFQSSSQRYLFWMQAKSQARNGDASWFSPRDLKIGDIVDRLLQGEEVDPKQELSLVSHNDDQDEDNDEPMEDVEGARRPHDHHSGGSGGAGPDATGGDVRQEGESSREGGADGARAASTSANDAAAAAVKNLLDSLKAQGFGQQAEPKEEKYPHLTHLLPSETTLPMIEVASEEYVDTLLGLLPPTVVMLAAGFGASGSGGEPAPDAVEVARESMDLDTKKTLLRRVVRSPQFHQSLASLSLALRDGGLPGVADALGIRVENGGYMKGGAMPLGGGGAIQAFVEGAKKTVEEE